jgi:hypothetical protein
VIRKNITYKAEHRLDSNVTSSLLHTYDIFILYAVHIILCMRKYYDNVLYVTDVST